MIGGGHFQCLNERALYGQGGSFDVVHGDSCVHVRVFSELAQLRAELAELLSRLAEVRAEIGERRNQGRCCHFVGAKRRRV
jgi:hypothetical protein